MGYLDLENFQKVLENCKEVCQNNNSNIKYLYILNNSTYADEITKEELINLFDNLEEYLTEEEIELFWYKYNGSDICKYFYFSSEIVKERRAL